MTRPHTTHSVGARRALCLDISSKCVGWAVFENGQPIAFAQFMPEGEDHGAKLASFHSWLHTQFERWAVEDVVFEVPYPSRQAHVFGVLSMYIGALLCEHHVWFGMDIPSHNRIPPREVKRLNGLPSGGSYEQNKALAVQKVNELYQLQLRYNPRDRHKTESQDDTADALLLGRAWYMRFDPRDSVEAGV